MTDIELPCILVILILLIVVILHILTIRENRRLKENFNFCEQDFIKIKKESINKSKADQQVILHGEIEIAELKNSLDASRESYMEMIKNFEKLLHCSSRNMRDIINKENPERKMIGLGQEDPPNVLEKYDKGDDS